MKKIKAQNGYTIYEATEKDESKYNVTAGYFYLYFSSDIRDFGLSNSEWDWEAGSIEEATAWANSGNYATAREMVEAETTCATYEQIAAVEATLDAAQEEQDWSAESERVRAAVAANLPGLVDDRTPYERCIARDPENENAWRLPGYPGPLWCLRYTLTGYCTAYYPSKRKMQDALEELPKHGGHDFKATYRADSASEWEEIPAETRQEETDRKNWETCRRIAEEVELYAFGDACKCPECGEVHHLDDIYNPDDETYTCPGCGAVVDRDDLEDVYLGDYLADCLDIEYRCGADREYRSVRVMVTCGGPNIFIDTATRSVELYWWSNRASYLLDFDAVEMLDQWAAETWEVL